MSRILQVISILLVVALTACGGASSDDPRELALTDINYALDQVDKINILGDPFMTTVSQTAMRTRLQQAREYVLSGDKSNAVERLSLVIVDAEELMAMANYAGNVEGSPASIRDACRRAITFIRAYTPIPVPSAARTTTPGATPTATPSPIPTSTPSPTPTVDVATLMQEVREHFAEAAAFEGEHDFEAAQESAFQALAFYLSLPEIEEMSEEEIADELLSLGEEAGVEMWVMGVDLLRVEPALYLVKFGLYPLALFWGQAGIPFDCYPVTEGDAISDAHVVGDEMGIIFASIGASSVNPYYLLLRRVDPGWEKVWPTELEPRDDLWIATDGEITFASDDLSLLQVKGSSFLVDYPEEIFFECHACAHRFFSALWEQREDEYVPQVTLPPDAPFYDRLWEITQPNPYASLFEFLRRLRAGDETGALQLSSDPSVVEKAKVLGLDDPAVTYMVEWGPESQATLPFSTEDLTRQFVATFEQPSEGEHWLLTDIEAQ